MENEKTIQAGGGMHVPITQTQERVVKRAVAAGEARNPADFVHRLIDVYAASAKKQAEVEQALHTSLDSGFETFSSAQDHRESVLDGFETRLARGEA